MEAGEWNKVKEIVALLAKEELEEQHGVSFHHIYHSFTYEHRRLLLPCNLILLVLQN